MRVVVLMVISAPMAGAGTVKVMLRRPVIMLTDAETSFKDGAAWYPITVVPAPLSCWHMPVGSILPI